MDVSARTTLGLRSAEHVSIVRAKRRSESKGDESLHSGARGRHRARLCKPSSQEHAQSRIE